MILFINVFLTSKRYSVFDRGCFGSVDALDAFRYMLRSLTDLKYDYVYIFAELDKDDYSADDEKILECDVANLFGSDNVEFRLQRLLKLEDWRRFLKGSLFVHDMPVLYSGNHDHIFLDRDNEVFDACLTQLKNLRPQHKKVSFILSHWAEYFSYRTRLLHQGSYGFIHTSNYRDAMQVLTPELLSEWFFDDTADKAGDTIIRRTEDIGWAAPRIFIQIIPGRELFRHLDGSSHFGARVKNWPALRVPYGLLQDELKLAYIAEKNVEELVKYESEGYVCISPYFDYRINNKYGVEFKWLPEDVPQFMRSSAKSFIVVGQRQHVKEFQLRDKSYSEMLLDMLPLDVSALTYLSPLAVISGKNNEPPQLQVSTLQTRRNESILTLKAPFESKPIFCLLNETDETFLSEATKTLWKSLNPEKVNRIYVKSVERERASWHVQGFAPRMAGELYDKTDGLYCYLYDFSANKAEVLRWMHKEVLASVFVLLRPGIAHHSEIIANWSNGLHSLQENEVFVLVESQLNPSKIFAIALSSPFLNLILSTYPRLYCGEGMFLDEFLLQIANQFSGVVRVNKVFLDSLIPPEQVNSYNSKYSDGNEESVTANLTQWVHVCNSAATDDALFKSFRRIPIVQNVVEGTPAEGGVWNLQRLSTDQYFLQSLPLIQSSDLFGDPAILLEFKLGDRVFKLNPTTIRYANNACNVLSLFGAEVFGNPFYEIGAGYGGEMKVFSDIARGIGLEDLNWSIFDLVSSYGLITRWLSNFAYAANFISLKDSFLVADDSTIISCGALSEMRGGLLSAYLERVVLKCRRGYFITNFESHSLPFGGFSTDNFLDYLKSNGKSDAELLDPLRYLSKFDAEAGSKLIVFGHKD